ncbi:MAG TPA: hypothetical protein VHG71_11245 [Verrucomicrobiae bacterium]|nr:hypothetical protein [Verrucomicrobiae bacterium]
MHAGDYWPVDFLPLPKLLPVGAIHFDTMRAPHEIEHLLKEHSSQLG